MKQAKRRKAAPKTSRVAKPLGKSGLKPSRKTKTDGEASKKSNLIGPTSTVAEQREIYLKSLRKIKGATVKILVAEPDHTVYSVAIPWELGGYYVPVIIRHRKPRAIKPRNDGSAKKPIKRKKKLDVAT